MTQSSARMSAVGGRWGVLAVTAPAVFMAMLDVTIVNIAFPDLRRSFVDVSLAQLSWVINGYGIVFAAALVPAGRMADRFGRKRFFMAGLVVFLLASVACGLAPSVAVLVAARVVQALGAAVLIPTSLGLVLYAFPAESRALVTAVWTSIGAIAAAVGPSAGGLLVQWQGWRAVFFVNLAIGLMALLPAWRVTRESRDEAAHGWPDLVGSGLVATSVGALALGLTQGQAWGWSSSPRVWAAFGIAVIALAGLVVRSANHPQPVVDLSLFRIPSFAVANTGAFVFGAGFFGILLLNVLFLTGVWHYSILGAGGALTPGPLVAALVAPVAGRLVSRFGPRLVGVAGNLLFGTGSLLLAIATGPIAQYWTQFFPGALATGAGIGLSMPAFGAAVVVGLPRARFATGSAILACCRQLGGVVGIALLVTFLTPAVLADAGRFHRAWLLITVVGLGAAVISLALGPAGWRGPRMRARK